MVAIKAKDHKLALVYAQNIVYLSPRDPRGYLRLAQVLRLMNRPATALAVYQQGVVLVAKADSNHPGLQALKEQAAILDKLVSQVDPFQVLPAELLVLVLRQLTTRQHWYVSLHASSHYCAPRPSNNIPVAVSRYPKRGRGSWRALLLNLSGPSNTLTSDQREEATSASG